MLIDLLELAFAITPLITFSQISIVLSSGFTILIFVPSKAFLKRLDSIVVLVAKRPTLLNFDDITLSRTASIREIILFPLLKPEI